MHSDDAHGKKGGFFSKIFGHDDDKADPKTESNPNVIHPEDAQAAGVANMATGSVPDDNSSTASDPSSAISTATPAAVEADISQGSMSDVHAVAKSDHEPLNLNTSATETTPVTAPSPSDAEPETKAEAAVDAELDASKALDESSTPAAIPDATPVNTPNSDEDPDLAALKAAQAAHGGSPVAVMPDPSLAVEGTSPPEANTDVAAEPANDANTFNIQEIASAPIASPDSQSMPAVGDSNSTEASASTDSNEVTNAESTPANSVQTDTEPPAPPVQEGEAWTASQPSFTDSISKSSLEANSTEANSVEVNPNESAADAQAAVTGILASRPDLTTDGGGAVSTPDASAPTAEAEKPAADPELKASLLRLEQHIDDLDEGLQKVRDELNSLKSKL